MDLQLRERLALVTGSTAGIGFAIAESLAKEGARVVVNGRTDDAVDRAVAQLTEATSGTVLGFAGDLSDAAVAERLSERFRDVEILVNNLGIFEPKPFEEIPDADWRRLFEINVLSGVRLARLYLPAMRRRNWGRIIFISSESAVHIPSEMIHYGVSEIAQIGVARGLAEAVAGTGIHGEQRAPRPDAVTGSRAFRTGAGGRAGEVVGRVRGRVLRDRATDIAASPLRDAQRGRLPGGLRCQPACGRHHRRGVTCRRRSDQERAMTSDRGSR